MHVVPGHTRNALFQLLCDLRANTPKDQRFAVRHARALAPRSVAGWIACVSCASSLAAVVAVLVCITLAVSLGGMCVVGGAALFLGAALGVAFGCMMTVLMLTSLVCGALGIAGFWTYAAVAGTQAVLVRTAAFLRAMFSDAARSSSEDEVGTALKGARPRVVHVRGQGGGLVWLLLLGPEGTE